MVRASPRRRGKSSRSGAAEGRVGRDGGPSVRGETSVPQGKFRWYRGFVFALSREAWGGFLFPPERGAGARPDGRGGGALRWRSGGLYSRWRAGWSAALWGLVQCTPHSLFCEKRECAVHGGREKTGARQGADGLLRKTSARGVVQAGVLAVDVRTVRSSSLPLIWRLGKKRLLWGLTPRAGHFFRDCPSFNQTRC